MVAQLDDFDSEPERRSLFLTWLCVLTFIGSSFSIISCIWSYAAAPQTAKTARLFQQQKPLPADSSKDTATLEARGRHREVILGGRLRASVSHILQVDNLRKTAIGGFIAALLTLAGAILMWWLRKAGFYVYLAGVVFGILVPFYIFGNDLIAVGTTAFTNLFGLVFISLYALNLRSMR